MDAVGTFGGGDGRELQVSDRISYVSRRLGGICTRESGIPQG